MFAGLKGGQNDRHLQIVMQADVHRLDVRAGQQVMEVGIACRNAVARCHAAGMRLVDIHNGDHFNFGDGLVIIQVDLADLAHPNYTYAQFFYPCFAPCGIGKLVTTQE